MTSGDKTILDTIGANSLTIGAGDTTVIIAGNLTVSGTTTTVNTTTLTIEDSLYIVNHGTSGTPSEDAGLVVERGSSTNTAMIWDESADEFSFINTSEDGSTAGNVTIASYADMQANGITGTSLLLDGDKSVNPADGGVVHIDLHTITDSSTSGSGTAARYSHVNIEGPALAATNSSVTTSDASTLRINGPVTAGSNQTLTRAWSLWVDSGNARFDGSIYSGTTEAISSAGLVTVANQSNITGVSTITSGTWAATDVAVSHGGTGASSLTDNAVLTGTGTSAITAEGTLSFTGDVLTASSTSADLPMIELTNTHAGATAGKIRFNKDSASGDDNDVMGTIEFYGTDAGEATHERLAYIDSYIIDSAAGSEAAGLRFYVAENDATLTAGLQIQGQADDNGEVDVTIGAGAASTTTIAGTLTMGSTAAMTNAGLVSVANQSNITGLGTISSGVWNGTAITHAYINDDIVSGQDEITTGFAAADELMYSDAGTIKRVGLDTIATKLFSVASAGTVAQASDHMLFLDGGATGDVIVESIDDFLTAIAGSGVSVSSSQLTASGGVSDGKAIAYALIFGN